MTAVELIERCRRLRNPLRLSRDGLKIAADRAPPERVADNICRQKDEVRYFLAMEERALTSRRLLSLESGVHMELPDEVRRLRERLSLLEAVLGDFNRRGLNSWYAKGWIMVHSQLLNEVVVVVRDDSVELPSGAAAFPCYRFSEVQELQGMDQETIRRVHGLKKTFRGEIVAGDGEARRSARPGTKPPQ